LTVYTVLFERLLDDIASGYSSSTPKRDKATARSRVEKEGFSFFTKTLPRIGKAFDKALQGKEPFNPIGWKTDKETKLPSFLGWLFERIFTSDGFIRDGRDVSRTYVFAHEENSSASYSTSHADVRAIAHVRQLVFLLYKLELPYERAETQRVLDGFIATQEELSELNLRGCDAILKEARAIIRRVLSGCCPRDIIPRHGPGAVATGEDVLEKSKFSRIYESVEGFYPFTEYFQYSVNQTIDQYDRLQACAQLSSGTAKVVLVPKDSRGPRLISCEPLELQWVQQGQQRKLYDLVESHWLTKGQINFSDQSMNRYLALKGSTCEHTFVTLDMKDASDRVTCELVRALFASTEWYEALLATRSTHTALPDGRIVKLASFAPMGSAVCFPIEAMCFYALSVATLVVCQGVPLRKARECIWVYGDDIICLWADYPEIMHHLERFGLKFNRDKCCTEGLFRESCGCDAYSGVDVTPIRLSTVWNHRNRRDPGQLQSYVSLSNDMYERGYYAAAAYLKDLVEETYGLLPYLEYKEPRQRASQARCTPPGRVIGWYRSDVNPILRNKELGIPMRFCKRYHVLLVRGYSAVPTLVKERQLGWDAMLRRFCNGGSSRLPTGVHAVAHRSRLTRAWGRVGL
jgi:hypothetical protein